MFCGNSMIIGIIIFLFVCLVIYGSSSISIKEGFHELQSGYICSDTYITGTSNKTNPRAQGFIKDFFGAGQYPPGTCSNLCSETDGCTTFSVRHTDEGGCTLCNSSANSNTFSNEGGYDAYNTYSIEADQNPSGPCNPAAGEMSCCTGCQGSALETVGAGLTGDAYANICSSRNSSAQCSAAGGTWTPPVPPPVGGCCQTSPTNETAYCSDYYGGVCSVLTGRSIGCNRGVWQPDKQYMPNGCCCPGGLPCTCTGSPTCSAFISNDTCPTGTAPKESNTPCPPFSTLPPPSDDQPCATAGSEFQCIPGLATPLKCMGNGQIACASNDGRTCFWGTCGNTGQEDGPDAGVASRANWRTGGDAPYTIGCKNIGDGSWNGSDTCTTLSPPPPPPPPGGTCVGAGSSCDPLNDTCCGQCGSNDPPTCQPNRTTTCNSNTCCTPNPTCSSLGNCPPQSNMPNSDFVCAETNCDGTIGGECCVANPVCSASICNSSTQVFTGAAVTCAGATCQNSECCSPRAQCANFSCDPSQYDRVTNYSSKYCTGLTCQEFECCVPDPHCAGPKGADSPFKCPTYYHDKPTFGTIQCGQDTSCNKTLCCDPNPTCSGFTSCPSDEYLRDNAAEIKCMAPMCTVNECCKIDPMCSTFTCKENNFYHTYAHIPAAPSTYCTGGICTEDLCCVATPTDSLPLVDQYPLYPENYQ
jgi:hypothetical protein